MSAWGHGYFVDSPYTSQAFKNLSPSWLDWVAHVSGFKSPRQESEQAFRYLELGSGNGLGLCLLAAAYPEGQFVGIDLIPEHIAHSEWLAACLELANVQFLEADLIDLSKQDLILKSDFHYAVAHGIATWVSPEVRQALLQVAGKALRCGGILYCSYNTLPGWLPDLLFRELLRLEQQRNDPSRGLAALERARAALHSLLGAQESKPQPLQVVLPGLRERLRQQDNQNPAYLLHEHGTTFWEPLFVAQMHEACRQHKLSFLGSATLSELFDDFLAAELRPVVQAEPTH